MVDFNDMQKEVKDILLAGTMFYEELKSRDVYFEEENLYTKYDKKCLALFMGILFPYNKARNHLKDYDITVEKVLDAFDIEDVKKHKEAKENLKGNLYELIELVNLIVDDEVTPYTILESLLLDYKCNSSFVEDVYIKIGALNMFDEILMHPSITNLRKKIQMEEYSKLEKKSTKLSKLVQNNDCITEINADFDFSIGREAELKKLMVSLLMPSSSVMITGPSGVGKSSIVKALMYKIKNNQVPSCLACKSIVSLNVSSLVSGCKYVGSFEEKVNKLLNSLDSNIILFIDEIHTVIGAGRALENGNDLSNMLKPYLDSGKVQVIGTTTDEEYEKYISKDPALKRRFEIVKVKEPSKKTLLAICKNAINYIEKEMNMSFIDNENVLLTLIDATDKKCRVYNDNVNNPDLVLGIIKKSFAYAKYYGKDKVEESDLVEALKGSDRIYPYSSEKAIRKVKVLKPIKKGNVISFPN